MDHAQHFSMAVSLGSDRARIFLGGELDLGSVATLHTRFDENFVNRGVDRRSVIMLDLGDVTFCDAIGLHAHEPASPPTATQALRVPRAGRLPNADRSFCGCHSALPGFPNRDARRENERQEPQGRGDRRRSDPCDCVPALRNRRLIASENLLKRPLSQHSARKTRGHRGSRQRTGEWRGAVEQDPTI